MKSSEFIIEILQFNWSLFTNRNKTTSKLGAQLLVKHRIVETGKGWKLGRVISSLPLSLGKPIMSVSIIEGILHFMELSYLPHSIFPTKPGIPQLLVEKARKVRKRVDSSPLLSDEIEGNQRCSVFVAPSVLLPAYYCFRKYSLYLYYCCWITKKDWSLSVSLSLSVCLSVCHSVDLSVQFQYRYGTLWCLAVQYSLTG